MGLKEGSAGLTPTWMSVGKMAGLGGNSCVQCAFSPFGFGNNHLVSETSKTRSFHYLFNSVKREDTVVITVRITMACAVYQFCVFLGLLSMRIDAMIGKAAQTLPRLSPFIIPILIPVPILVPTPAPTALYFRSWSRFLLVDRSTVHYPPRLCFTAFRSLFLLNEGIAI